MFQITGFHVLPPLVLDHELAHLGQALVVEFLVAREALPEGDLFFCEELEVAHFLLLGGLDLDINLVFIFLDQTVVIFEHRVKLGLQLPR